MMKDREFDMKRACLLVAAGLAVALAVPVVGHAQAPTTNNPNSAVTGMKPDRTTAPTGLRQKMHEREAAVRAKRADCRAEAKAAKISLLRRPAYVKKCVKG